MQAAEVMVVGVLDLQATPPSVAAEMAANARVFVSDRVRNMITSQVGEPRTGANITAKGRDGKPRMDQLPAVGCSLQNRRTR
jgi:hypothetical protein